jgi:hypothetical protein
MRRKQLESCLKSVVEAMGWIGRIELDYDRYAGYQIVRVEHNGAQRTLSPRYTNREMEVFLQGVLYGATRRGY